MRIRLTSRLSLLFLTFAVAMLVFPAIAFAEVAAPDGSTGASAPTIQSDLADYPPGATVTLTGSNWQPGESVHINVNDTYGATWSRNVDVTADASGNITDSFNLPDYFVSDYDVTATGAQSGTVRTSFTDANPSGITVTPTSNTVTQGQTTNVYAVRVLMGGNANNCTTTLSASGLPTGATASFSGANPRTGNTNYTSNLTVSTTNATPTGTHTFNVQMTRGADCQGAGNFSQQLTLVVNSGNQAPVANNDSYSVNEDGTLNVPDGTNDILSNDTDANNNALTAAKVSDPAHGTLTFNSNGSFIYTPNANYNGPDSFTYKANDGTVDSNTATVSINVAAVDDNPVAVNDNKTVAEDDPTTTTNVLTNDTDVDGGTKSIQSVTQPAHGTVAITNNGADLTYKPNADYCNGGSPTDDFNYTINGGSMAKVGVTVTCVNDVPKAEAQSVTTDEDTAKAITLTGSDADGDSLTYGIDTAPSHGTLSGTGANQTYTPNANYNGPDSFTFKVSDGKGGTGTATVSITVTPVNDAPKAAADSASTDEDVTLDSINVLSNDSDVDGDSLSVSSVGAASHGTATKNADGTIEYVPNANHSGPDSFTYTVSDGKGGTDTGTVSVTVTAVNDKPVANNQSVTTAEDNSKDVTLSASDVEGSPLTYAIVDGPQHGTLSGTGATRTYTPNANYNGPDSFTYEANDGSLDSNTATVSIDVTAVNDAPVAKDDSLTTAEDTSGNGNVLSNDTDVDSANLTATKVAGPTHGTLTFNSNGSYTYTPNANYNGPDSFTYKANDGSLDSNVATVSITVTAVNDAPVGTDDSYTTLEDTDLTVLAANGLLKNDTDIDNDQLRVDDADATATGINPVSGPSHGALTLDADGSFTYKPNADYNGSDSFTYRVCDNGSPTPKCSVETANVNIKIDPVNDAPVAVNDSATTNEDTAKDINVIANDTDVDNTNAELSVSSFTQPSHGSVTQNDDGTLKYTPNADYNGPDSFKYTASDGTAQSNEATVNITVTAVNDAPVAKDDSYSTDEDTPLNITAPGVLGNDTDVDNANLTAAVVNGPSHGTLTLNNNGSFDYNPDADYNGPDSFTYEANDGSLDSNTATVSIDVTAVNDAPVANADTKTTDEDTPLTFPSSDLVTNDDEGAANESGQTLTVTEVFNGTHGTVNLGADGNITFTPQVNYSGDATFDYRVCDNGDPSKCSVETAVVTVKVNPVNDAPVAVNDSATTNEDTAKDINVITNDTDVDNTNAQLSVSSFSQGTDGTVSENIDGTLKYTPNANYNGPDSFTYTVSDGNGGTDQGTVSITVTAVNDAPSFTAGANQTVAEDSGSQTVPGWASGISAGPADESGQAVDFSVSSNNDALFSVAPAVSSNGALTYTPAANASGTATVTVRAHDSGGTANGGVDTSASQTFTITVNAVNDDPVIASVTNNGPLAEGSPATIKVTANDAADGDTLSYAFDCDNNSTFEVGPQAASSAQCTFNDEGTYRVNVKVTDGNGGSATGSTDVVVNNAIPTIGPLTVTGNSGTACLGNTNVVKVSFSITDPGTSDTQSGTINWGDGTTTQFSGSSVTQQHSYSAGTYNITVNASDNDGGNATPKSTTAAQQVSLRYNVSELQDPVNRTGMTMSVFKHGSTVPLKVLITDCNNQPVNGLVPKISFTKVNPSTPAIGVNEALSTQPNDTNFLMRDAGNGQYIYNLNTKTLVDGDATYNATITDSKATSTAPATYGPKVTQNFGLRSK